MPCCLCHQQLQLLVRMLQLTAAKCVMLAQMFAGSGRVSSSAAAKHIHQKNSVQTHTSQESLFLFIGFIILPSTAGWSVSGPDLFKPLHDLFQGCWTVHYGHPETSPGQCWRFVDVEFTYSFYGGAKQLPLNVSHLFPDDIPLFH